MKFVQMLEKNNVVTVSLNRPDVRNAFNPEMIQELTTCFKNLNSKTDISAVVLRGEGKSFCAGADLSWMKDMVQFSLAQNKKDSEELMAMFQAIYDCSAPVIGVAHGAAFGGALGLLACCDYVLCEEKTQMCFSEVRLGLAPAVISAFVLKKCTPGVVNPLMISGRVFTAPEAQMAGLVHAIVDEESLPDKLESALGWFKEAGPQAVRATKKLTQTLPQQTWAQQKETVTQLISELRVGAEGQEGLRGFLEKRNPSWRKS